MRRDWCVFARRQRRLRGNELSEQQHETRLQKLENGHDMLSRDYTRLNDAIVKISESLTAFVVLQEQNKTLIQQSENQTIIIEQTNKRVNAIEGQIPQLLETRSWVLTGLGLIVSAFFIELVALVVK